MNPTFIRRVLLVYFLLCFYQLGDVLMTYLVNYAELIHAHQNIKPVFDVFASKMLVFSQMPSVLLLLATFSLLWFAPKAWPKWSVYVCVGLALLSVVVGFGFIQPIYTRLPQTGLSSAVQSRLFPLAQAGKILPAVSQSMIGLWWLNRYFGSVKPLSRWAFLVVFCFACFTLGTSNIEAFVAYPVWREVGSTDWLSFRGAVTATAFFGIYLIPGYLPMILTIVMFWHRPAGVARWVPAAIIGLILIIFVVTAVYFVPDLQMKLDEAFSRPLIDELMKNDIPYRGWAGYLYMLTTFWAFTQVELNPQPLPPKTTL